MNDAAADGEGARCLHCGFRIEPAGNGWRGADGFQTCTAAPGAMLHSPNLAARAAAPVEAGPNACPDCGSGRNAEGLSQWCEGGVRPPVEAGLAERVAALADECANSGCIHLNDMYAQLRALLRPAPAAEGERCIYVGCPTVGPHEHGSVWTTEAESQEDVIQRLAPTCTCPEDLCLGEDGGCSACGQIDPEWDCLRTLAPRAEADVPPVPPVAEGEAAQAEAKALREFAAELDAKADRLTDWMAKGTLRTAAEWALERAAAAARADREEAPDAR